jgi:hypothetical protein
VRPEAGAQKARSDILRSLFGVDRAGAWNGRSVRGHGDRVTVRGWALPLALLVLASSACGGNGDERPLAGGDHDHLLGVWDRARADRTTSLSGFRVYEGESHCEMDSAVVLEMRWPLDGGSTESAGHVFVRDPEGVFAEDTVGSFVPDAELPGDAIPTGWENGTGVELCLADDLSTAYAVDGDTVEAWPALPGG